MGFKNILLLALSTSIILSTVAAQNTTTTTTSPLPTPPPSLALKCPDTSWPPSSAFWFLLTLAIGCLAHPRGSIVFPHAGRVWRLSPAFLIIEDIMIVKKLIGELRREGWSFRIVKVCSFALLGAREGRVWTEADCDAFYEDGGNVRFLKLKLGEEGGARDGDEDENERGEDVELMGVRVTRRATLVLEEGRRRTSAAEPEPEATALTELKDWFRFEKRRMTRGNPLAQQKAQELLDARSLKILELVQEYEKGPIFRFLLWFPMVQQLCKACLVSGSPFTSAMGAMFMVSFLLVEILLWFARKPLSKGEKSKAVVLMRGWSDSEPEFYDPTWIPRGGGKRPKISARVAYTGLLGGFGNYILFCAVSRHAVFPSKEWFGGAELVIDGFRDAEFPFNIILLPATVLAITNVVVVVVVWVILVVMVSSLPFLLSAIGSGLIRDVSIKLSRPVDRPGLRFTASFAAIQTAILAFVAYFGLGAAGGLLYDCSTTWKSSFYEYLG